MARGAESSNNKATPLGTIKFDDREYGEPFPGKGECCGTGQENYMLQVPIATPRKKPHYPWLGYAYTSSWKSSI